MADKKQFNYKVSVALYCAGLFIVLITTFNFFDELPIEFHPITAIASSIAWFVSSLLFAKIPNKLEKHQNLHLRWLWVGIIQVILAILFWAVIKSNTEFALWGRLINMMLGIYGFMTLYLALVSYFFPQVLQTVLTPPPSPLDKFPKSTQEIINKGREWINGSAGIAILVFFIIGTSAYLIRVIKYKDESVDFLVISAGLGIVVGLTLSIIFTYKWQKWARQSGISEEELKDAAKSAGLWWPPGKRS